MKKWMIAALILCCVFSGCDLLPAKDMTDVPFAEIEAYRAEHPDREVTYSVTIGDVVLTNESTEAVLTEDLAKDLMDAAAYLQHLTSIRFEGETMDAAVLHELRDAFPNAEITCDAVRFGGREAPFDTAHIDLSDLTTEEVETVAEGLRALPMLETAELCGEDGSTVVSLDDAAALQAACPNVKFHYQIEMFGQLLSTDMERVEYFQEKIGDEGLAELRKLLPMMYDLDYLLLDWCGTSDEATAALREEYADRFKVVWRVFIHPYNFLTDTYKVWMNYYVEDEDLHILNYCTELRYVDMGHNSYTNCEWARYTPNLEALIMGDSEVSSLEPLRECKKLTFLEIFSTKVTDLSPLADCKELRYLNISNLKIDDITPLYELDNMVKLNSTMNHISAEQVEKYKELQPRCYATFLPYGDPTEYEWRYYYNNHINPRYLLLKHQMGYANGNVSGYPYGHVTEPITYESIGIDPPPYEWQEWD